MKAKLTSVFAFCVLLGGAVAAKEPVPINIVINGQSLDNEPPPRMVEGRVLIPLRKVFNALGAVVSYENKVITANRNDQVVVLSPDVKEAQVNGEEIVMDVPPQLFDGSVYVPLRFVAQALGDQVAFDAATKTIEVSPPEDPIDVPPDRLSILEERLKQLVVGHQGAILKVRDAEGVREVYYRGLDDRDTAPYSGEDHTEILRAIELGWGMEDWIDDIIEAFSVLPKREAVAFIGLVYSFPDSSPHDPGDAVDEKLEEFLIQLVSEHPDVAVRRQAVLSMAVAGELDLEVLESVLKLYENSQNLWETFPVQQYFQYHAEAIRSLPNFSTIRARVAAVNSLYTPNILSYLDGR